MLVVASCPTCLSVNTPTTRRRQLSQQLQKWLILSSCECRERCRQPPAATRLVSSHAVVVPVPWSRPELSSNSSFRRGTRCPSPATRRTRTATARPTVAATAAEVIRRRRRDDSIGEVRESTTKYLNQFLFRRPSVLLPTWLH